MDKLLNITMPLDLLWIGINIGCPITPAIWFVSNIFYFIMCCFDNKERDKEWYKYLFFPFTAISEKYFKN